MKIEDTSSQDRVIERKNGGRNLIIGLAVATLSLAGGFFMLQSLGFFSSADLSFERDRLRFARVARGELVRDLSVDGRIVATSYPTLYSPAQGLVQVKVKAGDRVEADQVLAVVESPELMSELSQENAQLAAMEADLSSRRVTARTTRLQNKQDVDLKKLEQDTAQRELARMKRSFDEGLTSQMDYDKAADDLARAQLAYKHAVENAQLVSETLDLEVRNSEKQLERQQSITREAERRVQELNMRSPVSGVVGNVAVDPRDTVARNQELLTVIDLSAFEIRIEIPETYADEIGYEMAAEINYEGEIYDGQVISISPEVNNSSVEGRVVFGDKLPKGLKQNQRVSTRIILSSVPDTLTVRRGPFLESDSGRRAWVVRGKIAHLTEVEMGSSSLTHVEIVSGLKEGDEIIISDTTRFKKASTVYLD